MSRASQTLKWVVLASVFVIGSVSAWAAAAQSPVTAALLLSPASPGSAGRGVAAGRSAPVVLDEGDAAVSEFMAAVKALPRNPVGEPAWRVDVVRGGARVDSFLLSERECQMLGTRVSALLQRVRQPASSFLYRVELPGNPTERSGALADRLSQAGFRSFLPSGESGERSNWFVYEHMTSARELKTKPAGPTSAAAPQPTEAEFSAFEQRVRRMLQPRPLDDREAALFVPISRELYTQYRAFQADPAIRELQVDYLRQRWLTAADRRNLIVITRYMVRTEAELQVIERYFAKYPEPRGNAVRPGQQVLQVVATDADAARVGAKLRELVPGVRDVRPGW